jgi:DNA (cytosine-5)-methyltransferase 1
MKSLTPTVTAQLNLFDEITFDGFCGGGGWSTGMELAIGGPVDVGANHDADAIAIHKKNHPYTKHYNENIFGINPREACEGRPVGWAHFSPDCTHFSRAKGSTPVKKSIRGLAWVVKKWAGTVQPRIISMENVPEFMTWGPLVAKRDPKTGRVLKKSTHKEPYSNSNTGYQTQYRDVHDIAEPGEYVPHQEQLLVQDKRQTGKTFKQFIAEMKALGYEVEWRVLTASDYGAPTNRKRLFILFRRDGKPIIWPQPTHGNPKSEEVRSGKLLPWRIAAECINFDLDCPSIFERKKPLAENTLRRIARGIEKFIVDNPQPFIVSIGQTGGGTRVAPVNEPLRTIVSKAEHCVVTPYIMVNNDNNVPSGMDEPVRTITTGNRNFLCAPALIQYHQEQTERVRGQAVTDPLQTVDTSNRYGLAAATMVQIGYGEREGQKPRVSDLGKPLDTVVSKEKHAAVMAFLHKYYDGGYQGAGSSLEEPMPTVTAIDHNSIVTANILQLNNNCIGQPVDEPLRTVAAGGGHFAEVRAFLMKYYGSGTGQELGEPMHTVTSDDRFGLVTIRGTQYAIVDIGMRMLEPRELYNAQGFPPDYVIETDCYGKKYPKSKQVARCGNAVPPPFATALVRANWPERCGRVIQTMEDLNRTIAV